MSRSSVSYNVKAILVILLTCVFVSSAMTKSHHSSSTVVTHHLPQSITRVIQKAVECRRVPGLSISVVFQGEDVLSSGFGWADVERKIPANGSTKFSIGSVTKTFTATLLGMLLADNGYEKLWDTLIIDIIGLEFRLVESRHKWVTVRDILSHRVGLASYSLALMLGQNSHRTNREFCSRFQFMNTSSSNSFRESFQYSNLMYVLAGCLIEVIGNNSYEALLYDRILRPLGMNGTQLAKRNNIRQFNDLAQMYYINDFDDRLYPFNMETLRCLESLQSAGGIIATTTDMMRWMRFLLSQGQDNKGKELISPRILSQMFVGQIPVPKTVDYNQLPVFDSVDAYGIGFLLGYYQGYPKQFHTGRVHGFDSRMTILKDARLGIFTACNGPAYLSLDIHQLVHSIVTDALLNLTGRWLNASTVCTSPNPEASRRRPKQRNEEKANSDELRIISHLLRHESESSLTKSPGENESERFLRRHHRLFTGSFGHLLFGNFTVSFNESSNQLRFSYGVLGRGDLLFSDGVTWMMNFEGPMSYIHVARGTYVNVSLPVEFKDYDERKKHFRRLMVKAFERRQPPTFVRDLKWSNEVSSSVSSYGNDGNHTARVDLFLLILFSISNFLQSMTKRF